MKNRKRNLRGLLIFILILSAVFYTQYPKLNIISGYTAKNLASWVYISGRTETSVVENDHSAGLISLATEEIVPESASATSTVFGMHKRQAVFREGLGVVLLPKSSKLPDSYLVPRRFQVSSALPYPLGHGIPTDTVFPEVDYTQLQRLSLIHI